MKNKLNFPEELLYENIVKSMGERKNFISNRGSIFPHGAVEAAQINLPCTGKEYSDEEIKEYISSLPDSFEDWLK